MLPNVTLAHIVEQAPPMLNPENIPLEHFLALQKDSYLRMCRRQEAYPPLIRHAIADLMLNFQPIKLNTYATYRCSSLPHSMLKDTYHHLDNSPTCLDAYYFPEWPSEEVFVVLMQSLLTEAANKLQ